MGTTTRQGQRSNFDRAALFAGAVAALWFVVLPVLDLFSPEEGWNRPALVVTVVAIALTPFALVWFVAESHLRWSPRDRVPRAVVGWTIALGTLALLVCAAPFAIYLVLMNLAVLFRW